MSENTHQYRCIVESVIPKGKHGPYAVATTTSEDVDGSITFSLDKPVWTETRNPENGEIVILTDLTEKRAGWRASQARFSRPGDNKVLLDKQSEIPQKGKKK